MTRCRRQEPVATVHPRQTPEPPPAPASERVRLAAPSARLDADLLLALLRHGRLRQPHGKHALLEAHVDLVGVDPCASVTRRSRAAPPASASWKRRSRGVVSGELFAGDVAGTAVFIVDDMIGTGGTMRRARPQPAARARAQAVFAAASPTGLSDPAATRWSGIRPSTVSSSPTRAGFTQVRRRGWRRRLRSAFGSGGIFAASC